MNAQSIIRLTMERMNTPMIEARKDVAETKKRKFLDQRSYVTLGGKTYLFGRDVEPLRRECYQRSMGWCEMKTRLFDYVLRPSEFGRCGRAITWDSFVMHHEPPYSQGGWDHLEGVQAICQPCDEWRHRGEGRNKANRQIPATGG